MNDLREVLTRHADTVTPVDPERRIAGVQQHIRAERQRRTTVAGVVGGLVMAVVAVGAVNFPGAGDAPVAGRPEQLAGHVVPTKKDSLGYGFNYAQGRQAEGTLTWTLPVSNQARLVSFASKTADDVTVTGLMDSPMLLKAGDFGSKWLTRPGQPVSLKVKGEGEVAAALYSYSKAAPGVTKDDITYRREISNGAELVTAVIGDKGQNRIEDAITELQPGTSVTAQCVADRGLDLRVKVSGAGRFFGETTCGSTGSGLWDPGANGGGFFPKTNQDGPLKVVAELVDASGRPASHDGARLLFAVYNNSSTAGGGDVIEEGGNVWYAEETLTAGPGQRSFNAWVDARRPVSLWMSSRGSGDATVDLTSPDRLHLTVPIGGGSSAFLSDGDAKTPISVKVNGPAKNVELQLTVYRIEQ